MKLFKNFKTKKQLRQQLQEATRKLKILEEIELSDGRQRLLVSEQVKLLNIQFTESVSVSPDAPLNKYADSLCDSVGHKLVSELRTHGIIKVEIDKSPGDDTFCLKCNVNIRVV